MLEYNSRITQLKQICSEHGVPEEVLSTSFKDQQSNIDLIQQMANGLNQPFIYYKQNSNLDRTFVKCNLKNKQLTKTEQ